MGRADKIAKQIQEYTIAELEDLQFAIGELIEQKRETEQSSVRSAESGSKITEREEYRRCGRANCRCNVNGELHGPYLYHYWSENGRVKSKYIGKVKG